MAARRLLIVMVILLVIATVVAIVAPQPIDTDGEDDQPPEAAGEGTPEEGQEATDPGWREVPGEGGQMRREVVVTGGKPTKIGARVGDHLTLIVRDGRGRNVSVPGLGRTQPTARSAPARFDIYLGRPGRFGVVAGAEQHPVAVIVATEPGSRPTPPSGYRPPG